MRGSVVGGLLVGLALVSPAATANAAESAPRRAVRLSLAVSAQPSYYRYTESFQEGTSTHWSAFAMLGTVDARLETPLHVAPVLGFTALRSAERTERNNAGATPTDMRVAYFFDVVPGAELELRPLPALTIRPAAWWDVVWYRQVRRTSSAGDVDESVFTHGPAIGGGVAYRVAGPFSVAADYRHTFLIDATASNTLAARLGFRDFSGDGDRDILRLRGVVPLNDRWSVLAGYRFESLRIRSGETQSLSRGSTTIFAEYPDNDHTLHSFEAGFEVRF